MAKTFVTETIMGFVSDGQVKVNTNINITSFQMFWWVYYWNKNQPLFILLGLSMSSIFATFRARTALSTFFSVGDY